MKYLMGLLLPVILLITGCGAGSAYEVLTYDNIIAAAVEAQKGVDAFNQTVVADTARQHEQMLQAVGVGIRDIAEQQALDPEQADALADSVVASLRVHLANYAEQEQRRAKLYEVTRDNLAYIVQISEQAKKFIVYRADIGAQWQQYLESTSRSAIGSIIGD